MQTVASAARPAASPPVPLAFPPSNVGAFIQYFFYRSGLGYHAAGRRAAREPYVSADHGALADGDAPQHGGPGIDDHVVLDDGMPAEAFPQGAVLGLGEA